MDIEDVAFLAIVGPARNTLLSYSCEEFDRDGLLSALDEENGQVFMFRDYTVFVSRMNDVSVLLAAFSKSNEMFVSKAFEALVCSLSRIVKNWCVERVAEKYDQLQLVFHEFVFKGIILVDEEDELSSRIMKRTFENMGAIKVNRGFASFLNKATKSLRK